MVICDRCYMSTKKVVAGDRKRIRFAEHYTWETSYANIFNKDLIMCNSCEQELTSLLKTFFGEK